MKKTITCFVLSVLFYTSVFSQSNPANYAGAGTEASPYQIKTAQDLDNLRLYSGSYFKIMNDIDLEGYIETKYPQIGWKPIDRFTGKLDGGNYKITNLWINRVDEQNVGLFKSFELGCAIKNLNIITHKTKGIVGGSGVGILAGTSYTLCSITNCTVKGIVKGYSCVGGFIGNSYYRVSMTDCHSDLELFTSMKSGGLIGEFYPKSGSAPCEFIKCSSKGNYYLSTQIEPSTKYDYQPQIVGGIFGAVSGNISVKYCYSTVNIILLSGESYITSCGGFAGGIGNGNFSYCYATGSISGTGTYTGYMNGGFVGQMSGDPVITECYSSGNPGTGANSGGFIGGFTNDPSTLNNLLNVSSRNYYDKNIGRENIPIPSIHAQTTTEMKQLSTYVGWNFDTVWKMSDPNGIYKGYPIFKWQIYFAGGDGTEENPYQITEARHLDCLIDHASSPDNEGIHYRIMNDIDMVDYILENYPVVGWRGNEVTEFNGYLHGGGHTIKGIWLNRSTTTIAGGLFAGIGANGVVDSLGIHIHDRGIIASGQVGGLVGKNDGVVFSCYTQSNIVKNLNSTSTGGLVGHNTGNIYDCYSTCNIISQGNAQGFTGGLVGFNDNRFANINTSYSTGNITNSSLDITGGIVGKNDKGYVKFCYFGKQTSVKTNAVGYTNSSANVKVDALTTAQMKTQSVLIYLDFNEIWKTTTNSYPMLQWQRTETAPKRMLANGNESNSSIVNETESKLVLYPNPTTGIVNINTKENVNIKIYNTQGFLLMEAHEKTIDLSSYSKGIYILNVNGMVKKVIKQ